MAGCIHCVLPERHREMSKKKPNKLKSGPKPEVVKIQGNWENAVWRALKKERPKEGWPKDK
jgi:hypothetical protein